MTTVVHQFARKRGPDGQTYIFAEGDPQARLRAQRPDYPNGTVGAPITVAICPDWRWARKVALGLALLDGLLVERERKRARKKRPHGIPGT